MTSEVLTILVSSGFIGAVALLVRAVATALEKRSEAARLTAQTHGTEVSTSGAVVAALIKRMEASEARCASLEAALEEVREEMAECDARAIALRAQLDQMTAAFISVRPDRCGKCGGIVAAG